MLREAQYYSLEVLCRAARPVQERIIATDEHRPTGHYSCEMHSTLQGSWERMVVGWVPCQMNVVPMLVTAASLLW